MSVGVVLITHDRLGQQMLSTASRTLGICPLRTRCLAVRADDDLDTLSAQALGLARQVEDGDGILVLTDAFGSTPSNVGMRVAQVHRGVVVAGLNLPMLLRVYNYSGLALDELAAAAVDGGRNGVVAVHGPREG